LKLNEALKLSVYTDDASLLDENINTTEESTETTLLEINKETGLKVKAKLNCAEAKNQLTG
jgi:hypothetical protein